MQAGLLRADPAQQLPAGACRVQAILPALERPRRRQRRSCGLHQVCCLVRCLLRCFLPSCAFYVLAHLTPLSAGMEPAATAVPAPPGVLRRLTVFWDPGFCRLKSGPWAWVHLSARSGCRQQPSGAAPDAWACAPLLSPHPGPCRILTGLAAAAAGAAAVALFVRGVARARRPTLAEAFPEQPYDRLSSWCPPKPRALQ